MEDDLKNHELPTIDVIVPSERVLDANTFDTWPPGYATRATWLYRDDRSLKKGAKPSFVKTEYGLVPVYSIRQTSERKRPRSPFHQAKYEFFKRFWNPARHDRYLLVSDDAGCWTLDWLKQLAKGNEPKWFNERLVEEHLRGKAVYGLCANTRSNALSYWIAIDLDLHLNTGGNLNLFWKQCQVILRDLWGQFKSQLVVSPTRINGIHLYFNFDQPSSLCLLRERLQTALVAIHQANSQLAEEVDVWNHKLKGAFPGKHWKVRQLDDLELYPMPKKGFRFMGLAGKVLLADREIGMTSWGKYTRGKHTGVEKFGFDLEGWWHSLNTDERIPVEDVLAFIRHRLPQIGDQLKISDDCKSCTADTPPPKSSPSPATVLASTQSQSPQKPERPPEERRSFRRQMRKQLVNFWLGKDTPPGSLDPTILVTARVLYHEGLAQDEAVQLMTAYLADLPDDARDCSSRLMPSQEKKLEADVRKQVAKAFTNSGLTDTDHSTQKLRATVAAWRTVGFLLSDKATWDTAGWFQPGVPVPQWTDADRADFAIVLLPALKIRDLALAEKVATGIVQWTYLDEVRNRGWGYAFLKKWLPNNFGIPCSKAEKQQEVLLAFRRLRLIQVFGEPSKGHATTWHLGHRGHARINGDLDTTWPLEDVNSHESLARREDGLRLLGGCTDTLPLSKGRKRGRKKKE